MNRWSILAAFAALTIALFAVACNGDSNGAPSPTSPDSNATPSSFESIRDKLYSQLDAFGINIGAVPDDIRTQLLGSCQELEQFANADDVEEICTAIDDAIEQGDPGKIDLVLNRLLELEPN